MKLVKPFLALAIGTCTLCAQENTVRFEKYGFAVQTPKGWHLADAFITKMFSTATRAGVVAHAKQKNPEIDASIIETGILLLVSKHPLGAKEDNPNITLSVEKSWNPRQQDTGATYLKLLAERFLLLKAPSRLKDEPQKIESAGVVFYTQDAINDKVSDARTKQQYISTYFEGFYVTFVISYNDKKDPDYQAMRIMSESFGVIKKSVQQQDGSYAPPAPRELKPTP